MAWRFTWQAFACLLCTAGRGQEAQEGCLALWGTFEDTGILQDPGEDLAGFPQEDFPGGGGGEYVLLFQTIHPVGVFCQGDIGADVPALDNGLL